MAKKITKETIYTSTMLNGIRKEDKLEPGVYIRITYGYINIERTLPIVHYAKVSTKEVAELAVGLLDKLALMTDMERYKKMFILNGNYDLFYEKFKNLFVEKNFADPANNLRVIINKLKNTFPYSEEILTEVVKCMKYLFMDIEYCTGLPQCVKIIRITETGNELNTMLNDTYIDADALKPLLKPLMGLIIDLYKSTNDGKTYELPF